MALYSVPSTRYYVGMNIMRRFGLSVFAALLFFSLLGLAWAHVAAATIRNRETVKSWLDESNFYDQIVDGVLDSAKQQTAEEGTSLPVDDPQVQAIAKEAFSPEYLKENAEKVLDGTYRWLSGDTQRPVFEIDLAAAKQRLADGLGKYATDRAAGLPVCTAAQARGLADGFDALNAPCRPPGVSAATAGASLRDEILNNQDFLGDTTFSGDDLFKNDSGQNADSQLQRFQTAYSLWGLAPYLLAGLAVLSALAVFFLSPTKRQGLRRVGVILATAGGWLALMGFGLQLIVNMLARSVANSSSGGLMDSAAMKTLVADLAKVAYADAKVILLGYGIGFAVLGIGAVLFAKFFRRPKGKNLKQPADPEPPIDDSPKADPAAQKSSSEKHSDPATAPLVDGAKKPKL